MRTDFSTRSFSLLDLDDEQLGQIAAFVTVVDTGSFSEAALQLRQVSSTISRKVARLETKLGVNLLHRTTRRVALTEAGAIYLRYSRSIIELMASAEAEVASLSSSPHGLVRLSLPVAFGQRHISGLLAEFLEIFPSIEIEASFDDRVIDMIAENFDLSIRIGNLPDSSLIARKLTANRRLLVASPSYIEKYGAPAVPADLSHHDCIRYLLYRSSGNIWHFQHRDSPREETTVTVSGSFRGDNSESINTFALAGQGVGIVADYICADALREKRLVRLLPDWNVTPESGIYACWPSTRMLLPKVRVLVDFLSARIQQKNWQDIG